MFLGLRPNRAFLNGIETLGREPGRYVTRGVLRKIGLLPRRGLKTRATDDWGLRLPVRLSRRQGGADTYYNPGLREGQAFLAATHVAEQERDFNELDQGATHLMDGLAGSELSLAALHTQADSSSEHYDISETARQVLARTSLALNDWAIRADVLGRKAASLEQVGRRMPALLSSAPSSRDSTVRTRRESVNPSMTARMAFVQQAALTTTGRRRIIQRSLSPSSSLLPGTDPRIRLNQLAARPLALRLSPRLNGGSLHLQVDDLAQEMNHHLTEAKTREYRRQQRGQQRALTSEPAPTLKPKDKRS